MSPLLSTACPLPGGDAADFDPAAWPAAQAVPVLRHAAGGAADDIDEVIEEVPVALVFNGISHAVMLASPADLEDFALGFALSENIVANAAEVFDREVFALPAGLEVRIDIAARRFAELKARRRSLAGRTGCGLCGIDSLGEFERALPQLPYRSRIATAAVRHALAAFARHQPLRERTGAAHAAAWVGSAGNIVAVREDVGRHNALDKLIGWRAARLAAGDAAAHDGFVLVSSRASYEMVQKTARAGIGGLVAVSAPTAMACRLAEQSGLVLAGFARGDRLVGYAHADRLLPNSPPQERP
ncbi:formate dehydrogenase accessory sulfurtransferase FdhD [Thauera linaloolentis]|uniref:Sulfur carrier protein FdhD n=1 Tax=Thauera linaloolentis (strain DSM 12138 / JCM 21573 / CCUG 41526 / CIP 105981 / IAM 15112 / NBRC 102519 / 47Lol) TaxID=1123367 RepID=N6YWW2_THAL4|nr:formate dehydrogenase accessory sulfurtransferase FdhD [Thauera linaloolentis]ENO86633.1 formate dehydrogenase formation protein, subunit FdhD [Thauera linaloolentis 47Lol = DSM 12138]MCM8564502.1 formate dehydrogenase accessory sulfurtransferase FdhD [Thauera linaloolentis]